MGRGSGGSLFVFLWGWWWWWRWRRVEPPVCLWEMEQPSQSEEEKKEEGKGREMKREFWFWTEKEEEEEEDGGMMERAVRRAASLCPSVLIWESEAEWRFQRLNLPAHSPSVSQWQARKHTHRVAMATASSLLWEASLQTEPGCKNCSTTANNTVKCCQDWNRSTDATNTSNLVTKTAVLLRLTPSTQLTRTKNTAN